MEVHERRSMQTKPNPKRALTRQRLDVIRRHLDKTDAEIARMMGLHRSAVHQLRSRYKIAKVHGFIQHQQRMVEKLRSLKPGFTVTGAARHLGIWVCMARKYGNLAGYQFLSAPAAQHFYWRQRFKSLPPGLTVTTVARKLGVTYGHAALLCHRHKYKATLRTGLKRTRVPIRNFQSRPRHERWLASLKPAKR
jgi:plasmid maintenance system antidote protein VapI